MSLAWKPSEVLVDLCGRASDGTLTAEDLARLQGILAGDPSARRFYARFMQLRAMLERYEVTQPRVVDFGPAAPRHPAPLAADIGRTSGLHRLRMAALLALAAAAVVLLMWRGFLPDNPKAPEIGRVMAESAAREQAPTADRFAVVIDEASPKTYVIRESQRTRLQSGMRLQAGDILVTGDIGGIAMRFTADNTLVGVFSHSRVVLDSTDDAKRLRLAQGRLLFDVAKQAPGRPLELRTRHAHAEVLGTSFVVTSDERKTSVRVSEGSVRITELDSDRSVETRAGWEAEVGTGMSLRLLLSSSASSMPEVKAFSVIDPTSQSLSAIQELVDGAELSLRLLPAQGINIRAHIIPEDVGAVQFRLSGTDLSGQPLVLSNNNGQLLDAHSEVWQPFLMAGDDDRQVEPRPWAWRPEPGDYLLRATPYTDAGGKGLKGRTREIRFRIRP